MEVTGIEGALNGEGGVAPLWIWFAELTTRSFRRDVRSSIRACGALTDGPNVIERCDLWLSWYQGLPPESAPLRRLWRRGGCLVRICAQRVEVVLAFEKLEAMTNDLAQAEGGPEKTHLLGVRHVGESGRCDEERGYRRDARKTLFMRDTVRTHQQHLDAPSNGSVELETFRPPSIRAASGPHDEGEAGDALQHSKAAAKQFGRTFLILEARHAQRMQHAGSTQRPRQ